MRRKWLEVDRSHSFDPVKFLGAGWKIIEESPTSSLGVRNLGLHRISLQNFLQTGENWISGFEQFERSKADARASLNAGVFAFFWNNQTLIPVTWREKTSGQTTYVIFRGTRFLSPGGSPCALGIHWDSQRWHWRHYWDDSGCSCYHKTAVVDV